MSKKDDQEKVTEPDISVDSNILEIIQTYPASVEVFMKHGLPCVGCAAARFESISDISAEFGVDGEELVAEIKSKVEDKSK